MNGGPASSILAQCSMENASGSARAVDPKGFHFPRKTEDVVGGKEWFSQKLEENLMT